MVRSPARPATTAALEWPDAHHDFFTAIQAFGLRLRLENVSVDVYVIDGVERPSVD